jgi:thiol:disulfide interchange protein DsbA
MFWIKRLLIPLLIVLHSTAYAEWGEGWDPVDPPVATSAPEGKVEVIEFFYYGCGGCFRFEPYVKAWKKKKPEHVVFKQVPLASNPGARLLAQFYYTAELMDNGEALHQALFEAIHVKGVELESLASKKALVDFAVSQGADRQKFNDMWISFGVYAKVQRAVTLGQKYVFETIPAMSVDGKYITTGSLAGTYNGMLEIVDDLVAHSYESDQ